MKNLRIEIIEKWKDHDNSSSGLENLFDLYDSIVFNNAIQNKIDEIYNKNNQIISITFNLSSKDIKVETKRWCGIRYYTYKGITYYDIQLSDWVMAWIDYKSGYMSNDENENIITNRSIFMLLAFEHELTHLMTLLWGYADFNNPNNEIKGIHGKLFNCTRRAFFETKKDLIQSFTSPTLIPIPHLNESPMGKLAGRYVYWKNSCYLDSLSSIIYFCCSDVFRDAIFSTNVDLIEYETHKSICSPDSIIKTDENFRDMAKKVQYAMITDYIKMVTLQQSAKCILLRLVLQKCYTDMKDENSEWDFYNASEIYNLLAHMFPVLMIKNYPEFLKNNNEIWPKDNIEEKSLFTFWDFMDPHNTTDFQAFYKWEDFNSNILVFRNESIGIKHFNDPAPEIVKMRKYIKGKEVKVKEQLEKARVFDEFILNDRYELVGALILHGTVEGKDSGIHYTAIIKIRNETRKDGTKSWVYYNDTGNVWKIYDTIPKDMLFNNIKGSQPEMFFYALKTNK